MSSRYRARTADAYLAELMATFPAVMITGPRAAGKTTTAAQTVAQVDRLDEPGMAALYRADPDAALRRATLPLLIDEWQEVPEVLGAVKRWVDRDSSPGQFVLTGSVRAELDNEPWPGTGRVVRMDMYPLTEREVLGSTANKDGSFRARLAHQGAEPLTLPDTIPDIDGYISAALRGGFPEVAYRDLTRRQQFIWLDGYVNDLITRDAAAYGRSKDPAKLRLYLNALSLHNAGLPSDSTLYRSADINAKTAAEYDQLLRNLYVYDLVPAWSTNQIKRLTKTGKRYLVDTGLAAAAAGLTFEAVMSDAKLLGRWFDAFAVAQLRPEVAQTHPRPALHHLRLEAGRREIDLVVELGPGRIVALEFKAGTAPQRKDARHLAWLRDELGDQFTAGAVIHSGPGIYELGDRISAVPLCTMWG